MEKNEKPTIGVCMIVKNEEAMLSRALDSVKDADACYILDTGSSDNTIDVAKKYTQNVYQDYLWQDDFASARNHVLAKCKTTFAFSLDADEYVHDWSKVEKTIESNQDSYDCTLIAEHNGQRHLFPRLFKNSPDIYWVGAIHNHLNIGGSTPCDVEITYGSSPAHAQDPERALRILEKEASKPGVSRELYYLGREYMYYRRYAEATRTLGKYVQISNFLPEKADAFLLMSQAYWYQGMGDDARDAIAQALLINAHFREAILWCGSISWEFNAKQWYQMARTADNRNVLFARVPPGEDVVQ